MVQGRHRSGTSSSFFLQPFVLSVSKYALFDLSLQVLPSYCTAYAETSHQGKEENIFCFVFAFQVLKKAEGSQ
jgi:hypothetical protein